MDLGRGELDRVAGVQAVEVRAAADQVVARVVGAQAVEHLAAQGQATDRAAEARVVGVQAVEVRAVKVQAVQAVGVRVVKDRVVGAPVAKDRARAAGDQAEERQRLACGPELAAAAARHLFLEWWLAFRAEPLAGAASRQRKSSSGFLAR